MESSAVLVRSVVTYMLAVWWQVSFCAFNVSLAYTGQLDLLSFALGQLSFSLCLFIGYWGHAFYYKSADRLLPRFTGGVYFYRSLCSIRFFSQSLNCRFFEPAALRLSFQYWIQGVQVCYIHSINIKRFT